MMQYLSREEKSNEEAVKNNNISLKAVVYNTSNRVVFVESDDKFFDILFSFLTMPLGTIVRLTRDQLLTRSIGCLNNLYNSIEILDKRYLRTEECKTMLLHPRNGANAQCKKLKLEIQDGAPLRCGKPMSYEMDLKENKTRRTGFDDQDGGVFVKGPIQLTITDELQVMPSSTQVSHDLFSKLGIKDTSTIEERTFSMGELEALKLLKCLLVSKIPLTEALLEQDIPLTGAPLEQDIPLAGALPLTGAPLEQDIPLAGAPLEQDIPLAGAIHLTGAPLEQDIPLAGAPLEQDIPLTGAPPLAGAPLEQDIPLPEREEIVLNKGEKIRIKLMVSKSKNMVYYAEADEKFVDLLFSFLTFPLGFTVKELGEGSPKACISHLYNSIRDLDDRQCLVSEENTAMLLNPKLAPGFSFWTQPLNIEEYMHQPYDYKGRGRNPGELTSDETLTGFGAHSAYSVLRVMDPKSHYIDNSSGTGFLKGPAEFTIRDDLTITPLSSVAGIPVLRELEVPFSDIEKRTVYVGKEEASRLLLASFVSKSALTDTFLSG